MKATISKIIIILSLLSVILFCNTQYIEYTYADIDLNSSSAKAMCVIESNSKRVIAEKNSDLTLAMASTTKIATAITAIEHLTGDLDTKYVVPDEAVGIEGTSMYLKYGEEITKRELLYGLMLSSGNDSAMALALLTSNSVKEFCDLMNETAKKVGAENTNFVNPHGLDVANHYTTAKDLALITAYALENELFAEISATKNCVIEATNKYDTRYLRNKNRLLHTLDNCIGVKTGFTDNAGRCIVVATEKDNMKMVCVLFNCPDMFEEGARLLTHINNDYKMVDLIEANSYITSIPVNNGDKNIIRLYSQNGFSYPLSSWERNAVKIEFDFPKSVDAPIKVENNIGKINIFIDKQLLFSTNICTIDSVEKIDKKNKLDEIIDNWF
ncbi:MAG: D-alanyl-D-alanine carboxypeptidase family protein [Christensenellales bacterium]